MGKKPSKPHQNEECPLFKLLIAGDSRVGKTSLLLRYSDHTFSDPIVKLDVDFKTTLMDMNGVQAKLQIWDIPQKSTRNNNNVRWSSHYHGIIIVYDVTDLLSFQDVRKWLEEIDKYEAIENVQIMMVGNKCDLVSERTVSYEEAKELANELEVMYMETSAKHSTNVNMVFEEMAKKIKERQE